MKAIEQFKQAVEQLKERRRNCFSSDKTHNRWNNVGITGEELAEQLGISYPKFIAFEKHRRLDFTLLAEYAEALGCEVEIRIKDLPPSLDNESFRLWYKKNKKRLIKERNK